ncbi:MAG: hypothetical protein MK212_04895 [Saprospiraceae bacterium]|nr:hypothetical protein [Saprospiraceae bacterium]
MNTKNYLFILLFGICIIQIISCKKDTGNIDDDTQNTTTTSTNEDQRPVDAAVGLFYCQKELSHSYSGNGQTLSVEDSLDVVIAVSLDNDSIYFGDLYSFAIDSVNQSFFELDNSSYNVSLEFKNSYTSLIVLYNESQQGGNSANTKYYGGRCPFLPSTSPHAYNNDLEGNYTITVHQTNSATGLDTQYTENRLVSYSTYNALMIGNTQVSPGVFHSHMRSIINENNGSLHYRSQYSLYWSEDSIFYEIDTVYYPQLDTIYYRYGGSK